MKTIRDCVWLWGQTPGVHHETVEWNLPGVNKMTPIEGCRYFGIENCFRVVMANKPAPPYDGEAEELKSLKNVVWSVVGDGGSDRTKTALGEINEVISLASRFENITGGVLDDFFLPDRLAFYKPEHVRQIREKLHTEAKRALDLWVVLYTNTLHMDLKPYLDECDVVSMWTWEGEALYHFDENFEKFKLQTPGKRRALGLYMWNYDECKPLTEEQMEIQFDKYTRHLLNKDVEAIIICSNCTADIGLKATEMTKAWLDRVGDTIIEE